MKRVDSVISLIYSLSKSEKKHFSLQVVKDKEEKDYLVIYDIITKSKQPNGNTVKEEFYLWKKQVIQEINTSGLNELRPDVSLNINEFFATLTILYHSKNFSSSNDKLRFFE